MVDFFEDLFTTVFGKNVFFDQRMMALTMLLCIISATSISGFILFMAVDSAFTENKVGQGISISRNYSPAHTQIISSGETISTMYIPESWDVKFEMEQAVVTCSVSEGYHSSFEKGTTEQLSYSSGRITDNYYCNGVLTQSLSSL